MKNRGGYLVKRVFAFGFDFYITGALASVLSAFINQVINGELDIKYAEDVNNLPIILFATFVASVITYFVVPYFSKENQTIMQKVLNLKVVDANNQKPSLKQFLKRLAACMLLESWFYQFPALFVSYVSILAFKSNVLRDGIGYLSIALGIISLIVAFKDKENSRMFHDYLSNTKVIETGQDSLNSLRRSKKR